MVDSTLLTGLFASTPSPDACAESPIGNSIPSLRGEKRREKRREEKRERRSACR
jgi:hypothetical protein